MWDHPAAQFTNRPSIARTLATLGLAAAALAASSCSDLFGPDAGPEVVVLTSIGGVALDSTENLYERCEAGFAARGAELYMLSDSMLFFPNGRLERRMRYRWRAEVVSRSTPDQPAQTDSDVLTSRYLRLDHSVFVIHEDSRFLYQRGRDGAILVDGYCGTWAFARVSR